MHTEIDLEINHWQTWNLNRSTMPAKISASPRLLLRFAFLTIRELVGKNARLQQPGG
jgi:hypothetical protein